MTDRFESNEKALLIALGILQAVLISVVYAFAYTAMIVVKHVVTKTALSAAYYLPVVAVVVAVPYAYYRLRRYFLRGKRLAAAVWSFLVAAAALIVLSTYSVHIADMIR